MLNNKVIVTNLTNYPTFLFLHQKPIVRHLPPHLFQFESLFPHHGSLSPSLRPIWAFSSPTPAPSLPPNPCSSCLHQERPPNLFSVLHLVLTPSHRYNSLDYSLYLNFKDKYCKVIYFCASACLLKVMTEAIPPLTPSITASLLSKTIVKEMEGDRGERFEVRVLFHMRGDVNRGTCITLHAFKQTEEQKASCITQVYSWSNAL